MKTGVCAIRLHPFHFSVTPAVTSYEYRQGLIRNRKPHIFLRVINLDVLRNTGVSSFPDNLFYFRSHGSYGSIPLLGLPGSARVSLPRDIGKSAYKGYRAV